MLGHCGREIIVCDLACDAAHGGKGVYVAASESLKALTVGKLQKQHAAVGFDHREGVELPFVARIIEHAKVAPIDFETLTGRGFDANKRAWRPSLRPCFLQILAEDTVAAVVTERA